MALFSLADDERQRPDDRMDGMEKKAVTEIPRQSRGERGFY
jgi:hypothetical protein